MILIISTSIELKILEEEIFNWCKAGENDVKASSGILLRVELYALGDQFELIFVLLKELEQMGILQDDPRLSPLIDTLKTIPKKTFSSLYGIDNIKLDFNQFTK